MPATLREFDPENGSPPLILPRASVGTVVLVLAAVRAVNPDQVFTQTSLKRDLGISQDRQGMSVLRFMEFLSGNHLSREVLDARTNSNQFRQLILKRLESGCLNAGVPAHLAQTIGTDVMRWAEIYEALLKNAPIKAIG